MRPGRIEGTADDDRVVIRKIVDLSHGGRLIELEVRRLGDVFSHNLRRALDVDRSTGRAGALGDRLRHRFDMAIA